MADRAGCVDAKFAELLKILNYSSQLRNSGSYFVLNIPNELLIPFTVQNWFWEKSVPWKLEIQLDLSTNFHYRPAAGNSSGWSIGLGKGRWSLRSLQSIPIAHLGKTERTMHPSMASNCPTEEYLRWKRDSVIGCHGNCHTSHEEQLWVQQFIVSMWQQELYWESIQATLPTPTSSQDRPQDNRHLNATSLRRCGT